MADKKLILLVCALLLPACTPLTRHVDEQTTVQGRPIQGLAIRVKKPFTFSPQLYRATWPAGLYKPDHEDAEGVYFVSERAIKRDSIIGGVVWSGGLYVRKSEGSLEAFETLERTFKIPVPVEYEYVKLKPTSP